jgi:NlpC/P60 family putative phage cell wall peptidase
MVSPAVVVAAARAWLGTPYVHQASTCGAGTDCLGLVRGVWRAVCGDEPELPPPYTMDWGESGQREVLRHAAERWLTPVADGVGSAGDILLFCMRDGMIAKHLGIVSVPGAMFIHAYSGHGVVESPLSQPWVRRVVGTFRFPFVE